MATADISKEALYDPRIIQNPARYAVSKGGLSYTNAPYQAISQTSSQHTYNINIPSQGVFVDRAFQWSSTVNMECRIVVNTGAGAPPFSATDPVAVWGRDIALCAFPLQSLVGTLTSTINDTTTTVNLDTVMKEVLRLTDYKRNRIVRTCPTYLDKYQNYNDSYQAINNALGDYLSSPESAEVPNGAYWNVKFVLPSGGDLPVSATPAYTFNDGTGVKGINTNAQGIPLRTQTGGSEPAYYQMYIRWGSTEKLLLSPFIYADSCDYDTGLFGVNNIQLVMNLQSPARVIRGCSELGRSINQVQFNQTSGVAPFVDSRVDVINITPSLDVPLPAKSIVPYMEFPRYITGFTASVAPGEVLQLNSQTITLPQIPDMLIIYVKPANQNVGGTSGLVSPSEEADWYLAPRKITLNFDNFSGLLASHTTAELYQMAQHNGLEMDWNEWYGFGKSVNAGGANVPLVGGFLIVKPGQDFALQAGQAPSLVGNFTLQYTLTCVNQSPATLAGGVVLYTIAVNSGFFETLAGSSRIIKGVLNEADIISAPMAPESSNQGLARVVGSGFFSNLGNMLSKARSIYTATKPVVSAIKGVLPEGKVRDVLGAVGYGAHGSMAGAGGSAGAGKKKMLSARLME